MIYEGLKCEEGRCLAQHWVGCTLYSVLCIRRRNTELVTRNSEHETHNGDEKYWTVANYNAYGDARKSSLVTGYTLFVRARELKPQSNFACEMSSITEINLFPSKPQDIRGICHCHYIDMHTTDT